jgi:hypothetical protein
MVAHLFHRLGSVKKNRITPVFNIIHKLHKLTRIIRTGLGQVSSQKTTTPRLSTVSSRASVLDPGSSLLETSANPNPNNPNTRQSAPFICVNLREPF